MSKARDFADIAGAVSAGKIAASDTALENISDSGTEGTKVAVGTTAQRGSTQGQIRFNTTTNLAEYYTGSIFKTIDAPPTVSSTNISEVDSNAGGNQTIVITGSNFNTGATVTFVGSSANFNATSVTVDSDTQITAVAPKASFLNAQEPYGIKVENSSGLTSSTLANQINVDTDVAWSTSAGSLGSIQDSATGTHFTVSATDADSDTITYSVQSGSLPAGTSLNSSTGVISGDPTNVNSNTTSNFTLRASTTNANADRDFSITVQPTPPYDIDYLVIAGGGSGGGSHRGGGGGAGGYRNSYNSETSGRNSSSETALNVNAGTVLTITVGGGGVIPTDSSDGTTGNSSSISGSGITTITSNGGGGGGAYTNDAPSGTFGSGAGAGHQTNATKNGSDGTSAQGFDGGNTSGNNNQQGGCGGGASADGDDGGTSSSRYAGDGLSSSITGSAVTRAGGGGAGAYGNGGKGFGGNGGGADGGWKDTSHGLGQFITGSTSYSYPQSGTANTGGGGGGTSAGSSDGTTYGSGGSGVVILRMPTASYSGTTTGSPTVSTVGSDKVLIFNGSGSYTT